MSRAYHLIVNRSLEHVLHAEDHVVAGFELLPILDPAELTGLLVEELRRHGFTPHDCGLIRTDGTVTFFIDPEHQTVIASSAQQSAFRWTASAAAPTFAETPAAAQQAMQKQLEQTAREHLSQEIAATRSTLQTQATADLETQLRAFRPELEHIINQVTIEALKLQASRLGTIQECREDPATGSLTIILEV